jgi:hypothetical protein
VVEKVIGEELVEHFKIPAALHLFGIPAHDRLRGIVHTADAQLFARIARNPAIQGRTARVTEPLVGYVPDRASAIHLAIEWGCRIERLPGLKVVTPMTEAGRRVAELYATAMAAADRGPGTPRPSGGSMTAAEWEAIEAAIDVRRPRGRPRKAPPMTPAARKRRQRARARGIAV